MPFVFWFDDCISPNDLVLSLTIDDASAVSTTSCCQKKIFESGETGEGSDAISSE